MAPRILAGNSHARARRSGPRGTTIALALMELDWSVVVVAGRAPMRRPRQAAAACSTRTPRSCPTRVAARPLVIIATPDRAIEAAAARSRRRSSRARSCCTSRARSGVNVFDGLLELRPDVRVGALHPLQSFPSATIGRRTAPGVVGGGRGRSADGRARHRARACTPSSFPTRTAAQYHVAAVVASNHLVALLGQVERLAAASDVPFEAFAPLVRSSVANAFGVGPARASRGPSRRGDLATGRAAPAPRSTRASATLPRARRARLPGSPACATHALDRLLDDVRHVSGRARPRRTRRRLIPVGQCASCSRLPLRGSRPASPDPARAGTERGEACSTSTESPTSAPRAIARVPTAGASASCRRWATCTRATGP